MIVIFVISVHATALDNWCVVIATIPTIRSFLWSLSLPSLLENAVSSIRMGVEDFRQQDSDRDVSAVRNFYAGVLLLTKEALVRAAPQADPMLVIGARLKAVPDGAGGVGLKQVGHATLDFQQIAERAADFGVAIDHKALGALNRIRNDMEHHYTSEPATAVRAAISKGFPVVASLFRQLGEDPLQRLGENWLTMLSTKELYDQEVAAARETYARVEWYSTSLEGVTLKCSECGNELVEQANAENEDQDSMQIACKSCGASLDVGVVVEKAIEDLFGREAYMRAKDTGEEGPIHQCPSCQFETIVEGEERCAACGVTLDYDDECNRCGNSISLSEYLSGADNGLCSYCAWQTDKLLRDD